MASLNEPYNALAQQIKDKIETRKRHQSFLNSLIEEEEKSGTRSHNLTPTNAYFRPAHHRSGRVSQISPSSLNSSTGMKIKPLWILRDLPNKIYFRENDDLIRDKLMHPGGLFRSSHNKIYGNLKQEPQVNFTPKNNEANAVASPFTLHYFRKKQRELQGRELKHN